MGIAAVILDPLHSTRSAGVSLPRDRHCGARGCGATQGGLTRGFNTADRHATPPSGAMDEILALQAQLEAVQATKPAFRFTERNVVDLVNKMSKLG